MNISRTTTKEGEIIANLKAELAALILSSRAREAELEYKLLENVAQDIFESMSKDDKILQLEAQVAMLRDCLPELLDNDKTHEAFESWVEDHYGKGRVGTKNAALGLYTTLSVQRGWEAWQAACTRQIEKDASCMANNAA